jgi:hypothetical protein
MPVQTQIQQRRGTAASWTSTNPTLAAGEIGFESDTNRFKIGTGSTAWASLSYWVQDPVTTKGDLYTFSTTDARLAVGANGETLVADSSTSTGLRYNANFAAGKNKIINGDFGVWQRGTSFTVSTSSIYTADRFYTLAGAATASRQTFTPGTAPVAGYEGQFYWNQTITANSQNYEFGQRVENARTFAGQTTTLSFWARSTVGAQTMNLEAVQQFGTGGSPSAPVGAGNQTWTPTSSWQRFTFTFTMPSVSGKTFGTNNDSYIQLKIGQYTTTATNTSIDLWGVQWEAGSVATAFQTATGTIQGELAACQRYFEKSYDQDTNPGALTAAGRIEGTGNSAASTTAYVTANIRYKVTKRTAPTLTFYDMAGNSSSVARTTIAVSDVNTNTPSTQANGFEGVTVMSASGSSANIISCHYTASSEL